jgi:hypothetical protein
MAMAFSLMEPNNRVQRQPKRIGRNQRSVCGFRPWTFAGDNDGFRNLIMNRMNAFVMHDAYREQWKSAWLATR